MIRNQLGILKETKKFAIFQPIFALQNLAEKNNFLKIINEHFQVRLLFEIFFEIYRKPRIINTVIQNQIPTSASHSQDDRPANFCKAKFGREK